MRSRRRGRLRLSGRCSAADLRRDVPQQTTEAHPRPPRTGRDARRRGLCALDRQARRRARHQRPGRDQRRHRHHRRADGFDPDGRHHRSGADRADRHGCVSGSGHRRHHPPLHQAQLSGEGPRQAGRNHPRGVSYRHQRPPRPGGGRHPQGRAGRDREIYPARPDPAQDLSPRAQGRSGADRTIGRYARRRRTSGVVYRRRDHQFGARRVAIAARTREDHRGAGHLDA